ncbi:Uncharacterized conserved protein UCP038021, RWD [Kalmanozyma brasiliensis GHG001]|uniref:Uncharacterized protein n=1 Tax=Kalmanozyma brasiliensis (strain GHG001) TaxID=1365824 RepID=V5ERQ4_KALBG|nr:Uncharacterized conserved protein UCP038021, RWD [Kalmanozyma brasiliensis GHG001]EST04524.1 Uncharacterized conserved protein UCP038021, RWD [Kalmanozyma brasiliensis GHG001]
MTSSPASSSTKPPILPPEDLASTLSSIELLSAMWSGTDELHLSPADEAGITTVAEYLQLPLASLGDAKSVQLKERVGEEVVLGLRVRGDPDAGQEVWVNVGLKLRGRRGVRMWVSGKDAPSWLDRATVEEINAMLEKSLKEENEEDVVGQILSAVEEVSEFLLTLPPTTKANMTTGREDVKEVQSTHVHRTWYYLPSLSTPSKRSDIVHLATTSSPPLTGFLLAGKPGLIVLEHPLPTPSPTPADTTTAANNLFAFWSNIKTISWSDIPSSHKKISDKLTETSVPRAFVGFDDVTDWPETQRGSERGRKSDLSKMVRWLDGKGVQGKWVLERVLGVGGWE